MTALVALLAAVGAAVVVGLGYVVAVAVMDCRDRRSDERAWHPSVMDPELAEWLDRPWSDEALDRLLAELRDGPNNWLADADLDDPEAPR